MKIRGQYKKKAPDLANRDLFSSLINGGSPATTIFEKRPPLKIVDLQHFSTFPPSKDPHVLHQKYVVEELSIKQIAREFSSSPQTTRSRLVHAGISIRSYPYTEHMARCAERRKLRRRRAIQRFGLRIEKDRVVEHKAEQKVIGMIVRMKSEGLGLRAIARCLTDMKVPTKMRGKSWHPEMVRRALSYQEPMPTAVVVSPEARFSRHTQSSI